MGEELARIHVPLHVTGLWLPFWRPNLLESGSIGAGLLLEPGAVVSVYPCAGSLGSCGLEVVAAGARVNVSGSSVYRELVRAEPRVVFSSRVSVEVPVPLGVGYAVSAIIALAAALGYAVAEGLTVEEAARLAHVAEVSAGTGLGDVVAVLYGRGLELRLAPGGPGFARVESVPVSGVAVAAVLPEGPRGTEEMHRGLGDRLYSIAAPRLARLFRRPGLEAFLREARDFAVEAGFVDKRLAEALDSLVETGSALGWYAKKRVLVVVPRTQSSAEEVAAALRGHGLEPRIFNISGKPLTIESLPSTTSL